MNVCGLEAHNGVSCGRRIVWEEGVLPFENGAHDTERARG